MDLLYTWLKDYVDLDCSPDELAHQLTMAGLETNLADSERPDYSGVVIARIESIEQHPNADKLTLCKVLPGPDEEPLSIVCGASNIKVGDIIPLATVGTTLPGGMTLEKTKIRGQVSYGMMCSEKELGLSGDHQGIMILPQDTPLGIPFADTLPEEDLIIEADATPNRPDLLCVLGVAREYATISGQELRIPKIELDETGPDIDSLAKVEIEDYDKCPRYAARLVQGVTIQQSPDWMQQRLEASGIRAINNIVDITNYVLLETNQPLHAFDYDKLSESRIVVRRAKAGEKFVTLDDKEHTLTDQDLMICDGAGPVAIAGVMGGLNSEVSQTTVNVLIESAYFNPRSIRPTARRLGISSEASKRFERGIDPLTSVRAADRAAQLMAELAGGKICKNSIDVYQELFQPPKVRLRPQRLNQVLGTDIPVSEQTQWLEKLEMIVQTDAEDLVVTPPAYRPDISGEIDLIEEVARLHGFDKIEPVMPKFQMEPMRRQPFDDLGRRVRDLLVDRGFNEAINLSFDNPAQLAELGYTKKEGEDQAVPLQNPLSELDSVLRFSLLPRLFNNMVYNISRDHSSMRMFEINRVFQPDGKLPLEKTMLSGLITRGREKQLWSLECPEDGFYEIKGVVEQILKLLNFPGARLVAGNPRPELLSGRSADIMLGKDLAGSFGELRPSLIKKLDILQKVFIFNLNFDMLCNYRRLDKKCRPFSKFPAVIRDVAFVVPESVTAEEVYRVIGSTKSPIIYRTEIFDVFRGGNIAAGYKSMAFTIRYQSLERTLTDQEVNQVHEQVRGRIKKRLKAELR